jgi:membrane dipeptidase
MLLWFDGHLDLTYIADHGRDLRKGVEACGGNLQPAGVTFETLRAGGVRWAAGTIFVRRRRGVSADDGAWSFETAEEAWQAGRRQVEMYAAWAREGWVRVETREMGETQNSKLKTHNLGMRGGAMVGGEDPGPGVSTQGEGGPDLVLALEGAGCLRSVEDLGWFVERGVGMVAMAWAEGTVYAGGDQGGGDVTEAGRALVREIDRLGCVHDVSHLSEAAFWTVMGEARGRKVASHSNCRALLPGRKHPERHLSDRQIRALCDAGGVIGVNLFGRFLVADAGEAARGVRATVADVVRQVEHIAQVAGRRDCVALGSDADSGFGSELMPLGLERPEGWVRMAEGLRDGGWNDEEVAGFMWGNWVRMLGMTTATAE